MCIFSGQLVSSEILSASELGCPIEMHRIPIEKCDEMYDPECKGDVFMPFTRANYDKNTGQSPNSPREQVRKIMIFREINLTKIFVKLIFNEKTTTLMHMACIFDTVMRRQIDF